LAADVSPVDVISHIPLICENKDVPYFYVRSRMELGLAA
jgi:ribosomal protein L7Ae-like RNA K-turn-binding protein